MRLLIVDFSNDVLLATKRMLRYLGHDADYVDSTILAAKAVERLYYDIVIIECNMPDRTALWFLANAHIPLGTRVIITSGFTPAAFVEDMRKLGAWAYLPKPFGISELAGALEGNGILGVAV